MKYHGPGDRFRGGLKPAPKASPKLSDEDIALVEGRQEVYFSDFVLYGTIYTHISDIKTQESR